MKSIKFYNCNVCGENLVDEDVTSCIYCSDEVKTITAKVIKNFDDFLKVLESYAIVKHSDKLATIERDFLKEEIKKLKEANEEYTVFSMIDCEGSSCSISMGCHFVNVIGYHLVKGSFIIEDENDYGDTSLLVN